MHQRRANADRNIPEVWTISARALIGRLARTRSIVKYGGNPHLDRMNVAGPLGPYVEVVVRSLLEQALHSFAKHLYE
jgi:hypothetical protein